MRWYVHYTVALPPARQQVCVAGPYIDNDVLARKLEIQTYARVSNVFVSDKQIAEASNGKA